MLHFHTTYTLSLLFLCTFFALGWVMRTPCLKSNKKQKENKKKQFDTSDFIAADGGLYFLTKIRRTDTNRTEGQILEPGGKHRTFYYIYTVFPTLLNVTGQSP